MNDNIPGRALGTTHSTLCDSPQCLFVIEALECVQLTGRLYLDCILDTPEILLRPDDSRERPRMCEKIQRLLHTADAHIEQFLPYRGDVEQGTDIRAWDAPRVTMNVHCANDFRRGQGQLEWPWDVDDVVFEIAYDGGRGVHIRGGDILGIAFERVHVVMDMTHGDVVIG